MHEPPNDVTITCEMSTTAVEKKVRMYRIMSAPRPPLARSAQVIVRPPGNWVELRQVHPSSFAVQSNYELYNYKLEYMTRSVPITIMYARAVIYFLHPDS